jgi:hypothetical protein
MTDTNSPASPSSKPTLKLKVARKKPPEAAEPPAAPHSFKPALKNADPMAMMQADMDALAKKQR